MKKAGAKSLRVVEFKSSDNEHKPLIEKYLKKNNFDNKQIADCFQLQHLVFAKDDFSNKVEGLILYSPQKWEKELLKKDVIRIHHILVGSGNYKREFSTAFFLLKKLLQVCRKDRIERVVARIDENRISVAHALEDSGFRIIETLLTFKNDSMQVPRVSDKFQVVPFEESHLKDLREVARSSFKYSRFHADPMISDRTAGLSRVEWIKNACNGRAENVLVAKAGNKVVGFLACRSYRDSQGEKTGIIDLMASHTEYKNQGIGTLLVKSAVEYFSQKGCKAVIVGTQAKNIPSVNLYINCGFKLWKSQLTFINYLA